MGTAVSGSGLAVLCVCFFFFVTSTTFIVVCLVRVRRTTCVVHAVLFLGEHAVLYGRHQ